MRALFLIGACAMAAAETPDPAGDGPYKPARYDVKVPEGAATLAATLFHPEGDGPWPVVVFSPGGPALTCAGYDDFGERFATWGFVTLVVAFGDRPADRRAPQLVAARDWLEKRNGEDSFHLKGKLDFRTVIAAGHSRGGAAAILAAADAKKFQGCLAIGPALRAMPDKHETPTFLIGAKEDRMDALYDGQKKPRWMVVVADMDHFMNPAPKRETVVAYSTAWLAARYNQGTELSEWIHKQANKDRESGTLEAVQLDD